MLRSNCSAPVRSAFGHHPCGKLAVARYLVVFTHEDAEEVLELRRCAEHDSKTPVWRIEHEEILEKTRGRRTDTEFVGTMKCSHCGTRRAATRNRCDYCGVLP